VKDTELLMQSKIRRFFCYYPKSSQHYLS